jgi:hypothetical protein
MNKTSMPRTLLIMAGLVCIAATASAQSGPKFSLGYAYLKSLESGGGSAPVGGYVSLSGAGSTTLELDGGYHREEDEGVTLKTYTVTGGPRFGFGNPRGGSGPFMHLLGGLRHDGVDQGLSITSWGGMAGLGVDLGTSASVAVRLGADFGIFWNHGESVKSLRLIAGLTF